MAEGKKSFILYLTQRPIFDGLSDEDAGKLIKTVFKYVCDEHPTPDGLVGYSFNIIKPILKNDLVNYEDKKAKMSENAKKRWQAKESQDMQKDANECNSIQKDTDIVNDIVIDNVIVNDIDTNNSVSNSDINTASEDAKPSKKPQKHKYGEFNNVLLTDDELKKLMDDYPNYYMEYIEKLSMYMAQKDVKYKSHYLTILNWLRKDNVPVKKVIAPTEVVYNILCKGGSNYEITNDTDGWNEFVKTVTLTTQQEQALMVVKNNTTKLQQFIRTLL